ncbi:prephenate dehydratase domain-containing protein [Caulobacter sp. S45]|jgi:prephenate dehydratase|uniref:prephenate dehydratase domain-containing protein n=1 Tax=Caulobacter sp. S45 TaxID=1641861 RepID=UPI00131DAB9A|nr:prephenate dehydratase domain-containing protein [Caulobacter sp. S45]
MIKTQPRVAFQGVFGAFSHEACVACLPQAEPVPYESFEQAFGAVTSGACEYAFIPVENSNVGRVPEVAELLPQSGLSIKAEHLWAVHLQLMVLPGVALEQVEVVASHPMALKQCQSFLTGLGLRAEAAFDTAGAARDLAASNDRRRAVVAARAAAELYGLEIVRTDVEDAEDNTTRFLVLHRAD